MRGRNGDKKFSVFNLGFRQQAPAADATNQPQAAPAAGGAAPPPTALPPPVNNAATVIAAPVVQAPPARQMPPPPPPPPRQASRAEEFTSNGAPAQGQRVAPHQQVPPQPQLQPQPPAPAPVAPPLPTGGYGAGFSRTKVSSNTSTGIAPAAVQMRERAENRHRGNAAASTSQQQRSADESGWRARGSGSATSGAVGGFTVVGDTTEVDPQQLAQHQQPVGNYNDGGGKRGRGRAAGSANRAKREPKTTGGRKKRSSGNSSSRAKAPTQLARTPTGQLMTPTWTSYKGRKQVTYDGVKYKGKAAHTLWEMYKAEQSQPTPRFTPTQTLATPAAPPIGAAPRAVASTGAIMGTLVGAAGGGARGPVGSPAQTLASNNMGANNNKTAKKPPAKRQPKTAARARSPTLAEMYLGDDYQAAPARGGKRAPAPKAKKAAQGSKYLDLEVRGGGRRGKPESDDEDDFGADDPLFAPHEMCVDISGSSDSDSELSSSSSVDTFEMSSSDDEGGAVGPSHISVGTTHPSGTTSMQRGQQGGGNLPPATSGGYTEMELFRPIPPGATRPPEQQSNTQQFVEEEIEILSSTDQLDSDSDSSSSVLSSTDDSELEEEQGQHRLDQLQGNIDPERAIAIAMQRSKSDYEAEMKKQRREEKKQLAAALAASATESGAPPADTTTMKRKKSKKKETARGGSPALNFQRPPPVAPSTNIPALLPVPQNHFMSDDDNTPHPPRPVGARSLQPQPGINTQSSQQHNEILLLDGAVEDQPLAAGGGGEGTIRGKRNRPSDEMSVQSTSSSVEIVGTSPGRRQAGEIVLGHNGHGATSASSSLGTNGGHSFGAGSGFTFSSFAAHHHHGGDQSFRLNQESQLPGRLHSTTQGYGSVPQGPETQIAGVAMPMAVPPPTATRMGLQILGDTAAAPPPPARGVNAAPIPTSYQFINRFEDLDDGVDGEADAEEGM